jgi:excisionase family DNA binding protein
MSGRNRCRCLFYKERPPMDDNENTQNPKILHFSDDQEMPATVMRLHPPSARANTDDLECLSMQTVAEIMDVSPITIRKLINNGKLKAIKIGKCVRVFKWSIDEYVRNHEIESYSSPEEKQPRRKTSNGAGYRAALKKAQELGISL